MGGRFQSWGHTYIYGSFVWMYDKSNQYCKAVINELEINNCLLKKKRHEQKHKLCNQHRNSIQKLYNLRKQQKIWNVKYLNETTKSYSVFPFWTAYIFVENSRIWWYADVNQRAISSSYSYLISNKTHNMGVFTKFTVEKRQNAIYILSKKFHTI